ncbi:MAG: flagellar hook capping FlgD N-terminal domain-containing protein [Pirellulaceae bacterium]|nr:flagellar hook capping FlgD N-terminal domain-containing protein [Pirellulaceae bacterium]
MTDTSAITSTTSPSTATTGNSLKDLDVDEFLQLMITELTNQDPLNPMDNTQLIEQIGQLRQISSTDNLSSALLNVQSGQSLATASSLIGKTVSALDSNNQNITGQVTSVSVDVDDEDSDKRTYKIHVGDSVIDLRNVREIES